MQRVDLKAESRQEKGKGAARKLRARGVIPAVLYGGNKPPLPLSLPRRELALAMQGHEGHHLLVELTVDDKSGNGETALAFLQELDVDPISQIIQHADFRRVDASKPIRTTVTVHLNGLPIGVRQGGVQMQVLREVEIEAIPIEIPERIDADISHLGMGQALHVSDLVREGTAFAILTPLDRVVCSVHAPRAAAVEEAAPVEGEEAEVAKEGAAEETKEKES